MNKTPLFESVIDSIVNKNYAVFDGFLDTELINGLRAVLLENYENGEFKRAGIGKGEQQRLHSEIRSDNILWVENDSENNFEQKYLLLVNEFMHYLNRTCFTGLSDFEIHYACYPPGTFYRKHVDSFKIDDCRRYSFIVYLNDNWEQEDGGQLRLYLNNESVDILPKAGRAVCFPSQLILHEVLASNKYRYSLTGWFKI